MAKLPADSAPGRHFAGLAASTKFYIILYYSLIKFVGFPVKGRGFPCSIQPKKEEGRVPYMHAGAKYHVSPNRYSSNTKIP